MDMTFTPEQIAFRDEVRSWIREAMPPEMRRRAENGANFEQSETMEWHKILYEKGWAAPHWPKEVGGPADSVNTHTHRESLNRFLAKPLQLVS